MLSRLNELPWRWIACWILLPNLAVIAMWPIGGPSMSVELLLAGFVAMNLKFAKRMWVKYAGIIAIFAYILAQYTTKSFNMSLAHLGGVHEYLFELDVTKSPEYALAGGVILASLIAAVIIAPRLRWPETGQAQLSVVAALLLLAGTDYWVTDATRGSYAKAAPEGTPIDSAILQAAITPETISAPNLLVVMVESWGVPNNEFDRSLDRQIWDPRKWDARYEVTTGKSAYYGSTTNAEIREWCAAWADHKEFDFETGGSHCLPQQLADHGFRTVALHSFEGTFFQRYEWYPRIGFDELYFEPALLEHGAEFCDGVFGGACDRDVPAQITDILKNSDSERNLVYWLTVNAHLPVASNDQLGTDNCTLGTEEWRQDFPMLCRSFAVHAQVADALTAQIMAEDFPDTDILIVGDHMPPFFPRVIRSRFDATSVPWIHLRARHPGGSTVEPRTPATTIAGAMLDGEDRPEI